MLLIILAIWFGYKKAKATGRNPWLWAFICGGTFVGVQLAVGATVGFGLALGVELYGWPDSVFDDYSIGISVAAWVIGLAALLLLFRFLDRPPAEDAVAEPPPPPRFADDL